LGGRLSPQAEGGGGHGDPRGRSWKHALMEAAATRRFDRPEPERDVLAARLILGRSVRIASVDAAVIGQQSTPMVLATGARRALSSTWRAAILALALIAAISGCASQHWVTLRATPKNPLTESLRLLAPGGPRPTARTMQLLRRHDLTSHLSGNRQELLAKLQAILAKEPSAEIVYAIAEIAYLGGKQAEPLDQDAALDLYGTSVMHAYLYLFDSQFPEAQNQYDPRFRGACDLYNAGLEGTLRIVRQQGTLRPGHACTIRTATRQVDVTMVLASSGWHPADFDRFEFVSDYQVNGLKNHYHTYGLGVPLIAIRKKHPQADPTEQFYPPNLSFPVTALLRVVPGTQSGKADAARTDAAGPLKVVLELYDPLVTATIQVGRHQVPLESDLSTPLAYFLNQPEFDDTRLSNLGLLEPDQAQQLTGLYMMEPYQPGKIPVLMVHGLWSSPVTWMEMFNDLRSAAEIRKYYQFWFYLYPTGQPFWLSAAELRSDLAYARQVLDPHHQQPALDQTILVGHSMGGLVSKLQVVDSGDRFWDVVTDRPFATLKADPELRERLAAMFFFQPSPSIRRVISIATPYRGSQFANDATRWLGRKLISMPARMSQARQALLRDNRGFFRTSALLAINTSIDSLSPESPLLPPLRTASPAPWVKINNIVGRLSDPGYVARLTGVDDGDGVVAFASASLDNADSQIIVPSDHSRVHRHPRAIMEVRRILLEHLASLRTFPKTIRRLPATADRQTDPLRREALVTVPRG
jgi:pimeloyl-ACP methyl ester carboxylesterase